jgi:hypothetical protein
MVIESVSTGDVVDDPVVRADPETLMKSDQRIGRTTSSRAPPSGRLVAVMDPPWRSAIQAAMLRPSRPT